MMLRKVIRFVQNEKLVPVYSSMLAIVAGLLVGFVILLLLNPSQSIQAFFTMLFAGLSNGPTSIGNVIYFASPIILTGLSVGFAFRTGLFNIGATGQLLTGGYIALLIGIRTTVFGPFTWLIALICAAITGALWSVIPGLLKMYKGVHEVVTTIMMNYVALFLVNFLVKQTIYNNLKNESLPAPADAVIPKFGLDHIFVNSNVQGGVFIAILMVIIIYVILNKTVFGFELKSVGYNKHASKYAGINVKLRGLQALMISGAIAGTAGAVIYLSDSLTFLKVQNTLPTQGFMGISVALLGLNDPIGIVFSGLFFGYLIVGGQKMQIFGLSPEVIDIITGMIVYFSALAIVFQNAAKRIFRMKAVDE